jgi:hypothetical protein
MSFPAVVRPSGGDPTESGLESDGAIYLKGGGDRCCPLLSFHREKALKEVNKIIVIASREVYFTYR